MVWDHDRRRFRTKAEHGDDVKALRRDHPTLRPAFVAYDLLWLNGQLLAQKPYAERVRVLRGLFAEIDGAGGGGVTGVAGVLQRAEPVPVRDAAHAVECVNRALDGREEGVVLKREDARYVCGSRTAGWCKVKPDVSIGSAVRWSGNAWL